MLNLLVKFKTKPEKNEKFIQAIKTDRDGALQENGNYEMKLFQSVNDKNTIFAYERWENQEALDFHDQQPYTKNVIQVAGESVAEKPEFITLKEDIIPAVNQVKPTVNEDEKVIIFFIIKIKEHLLEAVLKEFPRQVELTRKEEGNLLFNLYQIEGSKDTFVVYEHWKNQAALDNHFQQSYSLEMGKLLTEAVEGELPSHMNFVREM